MQVQPQVTFRGIERTPAAEEDIQTRVGKLEEFYDRITSCHVMVEAPHHHHRTGNLFHVRVHLSVPQRDLVVDRQPFEHPANEDLHVAIRDAFDDLRRQLEDYVRELRGETKRHAEPAHGVVKKLFPEADYGFIETPDGREIYFHANSVLDGFDRLEHNAQVRFVEEEGDKGPQATSIRLVGRHHQFVE